MKDKLSFNQKPKGVFYMCYPDLLKYFSAIEVCKLRDNWHDSRISSFFSGSPSCLRTSSSMFLISVSRPTWIVFQLIQEREFNEDDTIEEQDCDYSDLGLFVSQISEKNCLMSSLDSINPRNFFFFLFLFAFLFTLTESYFFLKKTNNNKIIII